MSKESTESELSNPRTGLTLRSTIVRMDEVSGSSPRQGATIEAAAWWLRTLERRITRLKEENENLKKIVEKGEKQ